MTAAASASIVADVGYEPALAARAAGETGDLAERVRLAAGARTPDPVLCRLATDPDVVVRAALALNRHAPEASDAMLANDTDSHVRALLGSRLAALFPDAAGPDQPGLLARLSRTLQVLVTDEVARVRLAVADAVKDMAGAPRELILHLARDLDVSVSEPVLRLSPVLTQEDLLQVMSAAPATAASIAGRIGLDPTICDAVIASANTKAIRRLLENHAADIREATLDRLAQAAAAQPEWHAPLVQRPKLSARAAQALAKIVSLHLVEALAARTDLPEAVVADLRNRLPACLRADPEPPCAPRWPDDDPDEATARWFAERLRACGCLNDEAVSTSTRLAHRRIMAALLAVAGDLPDMVVQKAMTLRSAKAVISLVWQGGFSARHCRAVQVILCQIPATAALVGSDATSFPLGVEEMRWQIDFLIDAVEMT